MTPGPSDDGSRSAIGPCTDTGLLARVAARLGQAAPRRQVEWDSRPSLPAVPPDAPPQLTERFLAELARLGGQGVQVADAAAAAAYVRAVVMGVATQDPAAPVLLWDDSLLAKVGLAETLSAHGLSAVVWRPELGETELKNVAVRAAVGITSAAWGIAETGSIVLSAGPGQGRLVSLLPRLHIALLPENRLLPSVAALLQQLGEQPADLPSALALATGPSRSADIENDLSIGVHGPAAVHVVILSGNN